MSIRKTALALLAVLFCLISLQSTFANDPCDDGDKMDSFTSADPEVSSGNPLNTGTGQDYVEGRAAADNFSGGDCDDVLLGLGGNDTLNGNAGHDLLVGGDGDDELNGGDGNDILIGEAGADTLLGGQGNDLYIYRVQVSSSTGGYTVNAVDGADEIDDAGGNEDVLIIEGLDCESMNLPDASSTDQPAITFLYPPGGDDLVIAFTGTSTQLTIKNFFSGGKIERIQYGDMITTLPSPQQLN